MDYHYVKISVKGIDVRNLCSD